VPQLVLVEDDIDAEFHGQRNGPLGAGVAIRQFWGNDLRFLRQF
jgi:hypothetical protein